MVRQAFFASCVIFLGLSAQGHAQSINHAHQYEACMKLVRQFPADAFDAGLAWQGLGGGEAAQHCIASALVKLKKYKMGAERLEKLADTSRRNKEFKAQLLAQAGQAWFLGNELERASAVITVAISLDGAQIDFYVDRAQVRAGLYTYQTAIEDLDHALLLDENHLDSLVFRGSVHRLMQSLELAWLDITHALVLAPTHQEALLERGMLYRLNGNDALARVDWLDVITQAPETVAADLARVNLERMDVKQDVRQP